MIKHRSFRLTQASVQDLGHRPLPQSSLVRLVKRSLGILALVGFVVSLIIHISTFFGIVPPHTAWLLHLGLFVFFVPMIVTWNRLARSRQTEWSIAAGRRAHNELFWQSIRTVSGWVKGACVVLFVYMTVNCWWYFAMIAEGSPSKEGSSYYLTIHGRKVRKSNAEEFHQFEAYDSRGFSGGWMFFYLIPAIYFLRVEPRIREILEADQPKSPQALDQSGKSDTDDGLEQKSRP